MIQTPFLLHCGLLSPPALSSHHASLRSRASTLRCTRGCNPDKGTLNCEAPPNDLNPKVSQVMNQRVKFLREDDTVRSAIQMFLNSGISGAPVLNKKGNLVGVLSETDVIAREAGCKLELLNQDAPACSLPLNVSLFQQLVQDYRKDKLVQLLELKVMDIMSKDLVVVNPESTVIFAAKMMKDNGINRLPVVDKDDVVGILTRGDVLQYMIWELLLAEHEEI